MAFFFFFLRTRQPQVISTGMNLIENLLLLQAPPIWSSQAKAQAIIKLTERPPMNNTYCYPGQSTHI